MNNMTAEKQGLLKKSLTGNATFSAVCGVLILFADRQLVAFLGLPAEVSLAILGVCLLGYAGSLLINARRPQVRIAEAWLAVAMDAMWVVGSYLLIFVMPFSSGGKWLIALVAEVVLAFAILQWLGIRRVRRAEPKMI